MRFFLVLLALLATGCDSGQDCTDELVRITVRVINEDGAPVKTLRTTLTNQRNLQSIGFTQTDTLGIYTVITDNNLAFVQRSGDVVTFDVTDDTLAASVQFTIGREDCHVAKFAGPDTIVAERIELGG